MPKQLQIINFEEIQNFVIFKIDHSKINIDVLFQDDTLWLTQKQIAQLFEVNVPAISKHLKNIFDTKELEENSVISKMETTATDGKNTKLKAYEKYREVQNREYISHFDETQRQIVELFDV